MEHAVYFFLKTSPVDQSTRRKQAGFWGEMYLPFIGTDVTRYELVRSAITITKRSIYITKKRSIFFIGAMKVNPHV